ncbi:YceI family protein [Candidatus Neomarinimicrobiota bacterium]
MKKLILLIFFISSLFGQTIDIDKSFVKFKVRNMGIRNVYGTITGMSGTVNFDIQNLDSAIFDVAVKVNTIDTNSKKRDAHLKNEDFFKTDKWPTIRFKSKTIHKQEDIYSVIGDLTIKDVTKEIQVPFKIDENDKTIIFTGGDVVNRLDYNVGLDYNNFKISTEISVEVVCIINK